MIIRDMFAEDINRKINGVVKVDQAEDVVIESELKEYVITKELKKHFISFFNYYSDAFDEPTADMGVWISGFFGSGKSHFLKILSYLLSNCEVNGIRTAERFREKFADDPGTFMLIDKSVQGPTETILFNIDIEGPMEKDKTAVLRVFAKMFYNHLGFYGEDLKVAKLEQFIEHQGKTEEFRRAFAQQNGGEWLTSRDAFAFYEDDIVAGGLEQYDRLARGFGDPAERPRRRRRPDVGVRMHRQPRHARLVPQDGAPGAGRGRIDGQHRHPVTSLDEVHAEGFDGGRLADAGHAGDPDVHGCTRERHEFEQQLLGLVPMIGAGRFDPGDGPRQRGAVTIPDRGSEILNRVGH